MSQRVFAYGYAMDRAAMARLCPGASPEGTGRLSGWRFAIGPDGYATVHRDPQGAVHGVLWRVGAAHLAALDAFEQVATGLYGRRPMTVERAGRRLPAFVYIARPGPAGRPVPGYMEDVVLPAARSWALPGAYMDEIAGWLGPLERRVAVGRRSG